MMAMMACSRASSSKRHYWLSRQRQHPGRGWALGWKGVGSEVEGTPPLAIFDLVPFHLVVDGYDDGYVGASRGAPPRLQSAPPRALHNRPFLTMHRLPRGAEAKSCRRQVDCSSSGAIAMPTYPKREVPCPMGGSAWQQPPQSLPPSSASASEARRRAPHPHMQGSKRCRHR